MRLGAKERSVPALAEEALCLFNGIDGETGNYLQPPISLRGVADLARREPRYQLPDLPGARTKRHGPEEKGPVAGVDARDLAQTGWGVVFSAQVDPAVREALSPLLAYRRGQARDGRKGRYRELAYRPGESKTRFLARHGVPPGLADPDRMPYYLLLVGDPEAIPFEFQYQLDVQYAVGRIHFDCLADYELYARTVVAAESGEVRRTPTAEFFAPRNPNDPPSALSADHLAAPLAKTLNRQLAGWSIRSSLGRAATKTRLKRLLGGDETPALLFTAGHGLCFSPGSRRQRADQGSLVCQEWPGPAHVALEEHCFGADDVSENARLAGLIAFHFSCYGAGTPRSDGFPDPAYGQREVAPKAFLSRLAQRLLAHPNGGALAVVGHVDRAWGWSFADIQGLNHAFRPVFESALRRLGEGYPLGFAMEYFNSCYAELASDLDEELRCIHQSDDQRIADLWIHRNDARNYAVLGDPAVRLAVSLPEKIQ